jgi:hypothetical protein
MSLTDDMLQDEEEVPSYVAKGKGGLLGDMAEDAQANLPSRMTDDVTGRTGGPSADRPRMGSLMGDMAMATEAPPADMSPMGGMAGGMANWAAGAGAGTGPETDDGNDPIATGRARLADLVQQQQAANAPRPQTSTRGELLKLALQGGLIAGAAKGGGSVGAAKGVQTGIANRQHEMDLANERQQQTRQSLASQVQGQSEQIEREQESQRSLRTQESLRKITEQALNERTAQLIAGRQGVADTRADNALDVAGIKKTQAEEIEDKRSTNRLAVQVSKNQGAAAVARIRAQATKDRAKNMPPVVAKAVNDFEDSQTRYDVMQASYEEAMKDPGNQQAQLNLLASHIGMTMSVNKARITQAIVEEAKKSGYIDERIEAHFGPDGYMTGVVLTPRQMTQMMELAGGRLRDDSRKVQDIEMYSGYQGGMKLQPRTTGPSPAAAPPAPTPRPGYKMQYNPKTGEYREKPITNANAAATKQ